MKQLLMLLMLAAPAAAADTMTAPQLIALAHRDPARLHAALVATLTADAMKKGTAVLGRGEDFIFAVDAATRPALLFDDGPGPLMHKIAGTATWYGIGKLAVGTSHGFLYKIAGKPFGGSRDVPAYGPDSYLKPGVPSGTLSEKMVFASKIYDGMKTNYWIYVPAQYTASTPAALLVVHDGQAYLKRDNTQDCILDPIDNLIHEKKIPVMIVVFVQPGDITGANGTPFYKEVEALAKSVPPSPPGSRVRTPENFSRSVQYDTVSDRYPRFIRDEILPIVEAKYNIRKDAYSRAMTGRSSGGIVSFTSAWFMPDSFSRVLSWVGSFTPLQPTPDWGGQAFPAKVEFEPRRNIRVWLQDGSEDMRMWPVQSLAMANALKRAGYDFHFSYGSGTHNTAQGTAEFPASMIWLWRDYDPAKTAQTYEMQPAEKAKPDFRFQVYNRDHGAAW
jgi:enterochelin esterase family protein